MTYVGNFCVYNGGRESYHYCDNPDVLVKGKRYKIVGEDIGGWQTNLYLEGVAGKFNSVWFDIETDEQESDKKVWLARAVLYENPERFVGKRIELLRLNEDNSSKVVRTSEIKSINLVYSSFYKIETENSIYITDVKIRTMS